jgi:hypothetical protein
LSKAETVCFGTASSCDSYPTSELYLHLNTLNPGKMAPKAADAKDKGPETSYSTAGTVSAPVDLDQLVPKGEHTAVKLNGSSKNIRPKPKVTLTSLTPNNVSGQSLGSRGFMPVC